MAVSRRVDIKKILADPDLRRKLMVSTIQATQAREGIETTKKQADRAYYVVTEGERAAFFDLARFQGRKKEDDTRHEEFVRALRGDVRDVRFDVARRDFSAIQGAPLAFRRIGFIAHIFRESPALDPKRGTVVQGLATADDQRFVRCWWEIPKASIGQASGWLPFSKGGEFSRFYVDVHLLVQWTNQSVSRMRKIGRVQSTDHYFKPGLTWPRAASVFNVRILPPGCIFADKGPAIFPNEPVDTWSLLGILNSDMALCFGKTLTSREKMGGRWEVGIVKRFPVPDLIDKDRKHLERLAREIYEGKAAWDAGNEISTRFTAPWVLRKGIIDPATPIARRLDRLAEFEASEDTRIQTLYDELNDEVYRLYGIPENTRKIIEETLGHRPPEVIWPQMEGKSSEQKRMEHVWRLLSYIVKRVVEADMDGVIPFRTIYQETGLMDRVYHELEELFRGQPVSRIEVDIINELKKKTRGYRAVNSIREWLEDVFFSYHAALYKKRPLIWHLSSRGVKGRAAFGALVHYHRFEQNGMALLRGTYLRETLGFFRREAALASREDRGEDRLEWLAALEDAQDLDHRLRLVQEGHVESPDGGDRDYRILTPWKPAEQRPKGWNPDLDDGVKVNIEPFQKAGVLRIPKVV